MTRCPICQRFIKNVKAKIDMDNNIIEVTGTCKKHKQVKPNDWIYEDFFPPSDLKEKSI